jgi:glycosyltransferase involved in cell wall biosynthesis
MMNVLVISNMYPSNRNPAFGSFVKEQIEVLIDQGVNCTIVKNSESRNGLWFTIPKYISLFIRSFCAILIHHYDVIHVHYAFPTGMIGYFISMVYGIPMIITVHGSDLRDNNNLIKKILINIFNRTKHIIAVSNCVSDILQENYRISSSKIAVIDMGVNTELFQERSKKQIRRKINLSQSSLILVCVGNMIKDKGVHFLLQAVKSLIEEYPQLLLYLIGDGEYSKVLKKLTLNMKIADIVIFVGVVPKSDIPFWLASADIVVHPTLNEAFGLVIIEAMSCGKIVVASSVGGIPSYVRDGENGFLVEPGDPKDLRNKIEYVLGLSEEQKMQIQKSARITALEHDVNNQAKKIKNIYNNVVDLI